MTKNYTVTCICKISTSAVVNDCKNWSKAAKKAAQAIQEDVEITHDESVNSFDTDWQKITENDCENCGDDEWEVTQSAELSMCVEVTANTSIEAATIGLNIAQDAVEIVSSDDVSVDWQKVTKDMVD